jgi:hypothetical protein
MAEETASSLRRRIGLGARGLFGAAPDFLVIGVQKGGTTSLYAYLCQHPEVVAARTKEIQYFSEGHARGSFWYRQHFPVLVGRDPMRLVGGGRLQTGEATPYYLFHPHAPRRVRAQLPGVKLIALLRNPIDRAYSHHRYHTKLGDEQQSFVAAIAAEPDRLAGELERMIADETYQSDAHRNFSYLTRGLYAEQLEHWLEHFPREQLLVLQSERFFADPADGYHRVVRFLGLSNHDLAEYEAVNVGSYSDMDPVTRAKLVDYYREPNEKLYTLLGERFDWD